MSVISTSSPFFGLFILGHMGGIAALMFYFERYHPETWKALGHPTMLFLSSTRSKLGNWMGIVALILGLGYFFRKRWLIPEGDILLALLLWSVRAQYAAWLFAIVEINTHQAAGSGA